MADNNSSIIPDSIISFAKDVSVEIRDQVILDSISFSIKQNSKIGVIGANGSGKTTLLKFISGQISISKGESRLDSSVYYVPQVYLRKNHEQISVMAYVSQYHEDWWDILSFGERELDLELTDPMQSIQSLSGGEFTKLNISIGGILNPKILLLDEPSNHLDLHSLSYLIEFVNNFSNAIIMVSHDEFLLDRATNQIWEINNHKVKAFQGSYGVYLEQMENERRSLERSYTKVQKDLRKARQAQQEALEKAAKSRRVGKELKHDRSMSTIEKGYFANKASKSAGEGFEKTQGMVDDAKEKMSDIRGKLKQNRKINVQLASEKSGKRRLVGIEKGQILRADGIILVDNIEFNIYSGDRVVITGRNGTGKTSLVKMIAGIMSENSFLGELYKPVDMVTKYLSQNYEVVDPQKSVIENVSSANPHLTYEAVRRLLGDFLFLDQRSYDKPGRVLSGGEIARLSLAILNTSPVDLLILDEPTNNLDIDSLREFEEALESFKGAVIVISHNIPFLSRIGVKTSYVIARKRLIQLISSPENEDEFFAEVIKVTE